MRKCKYLFLFITLCLAQLCMAQDKMSLQQCVETVLKNNFSIQIARNEAELARNDVSWGNAGAMPQAGLNASGNFSNNNTKQKYANGLEVNQTGVGSSALNLGLAFNWTVFDGMKMFATHEKLQQLSDMGELKARMQIEESLTAVIRAYFDVVQQQQILKAMDDAIGIYQERKNIAEARERIGNGSHADVLQASVDLNEQRSLRIQQKRNLFNSKTMLNTLLSREASSAFTTDDSIPLMPVPSLEDLKNIATKQNNSLLFAEKNRAVSEQSLREMNALRYPRVGLAAGYNFVKTENQAGFVLLNQNLGLNAGITASWNLFNGWNTNRQIKNARITAMNSDLGLKDIQNKVSAELIKAHSDFQNALEMITLEAENTMLAKENADIALEKFRLSGATSLELKTAQKSFIDAETRMVTARFQAKLAETELRRLQGDLLK